MKENETNQSSSLPSNFIFCMGLSSFISIAFTIVVASYFMLMARIRPGAYNVAFGIGFLFIMYLYFSNLFCALGRRKFKKVDNTKTTKCPLLFIFGRRLLQLTFIPIIILDSLIVLSFTAGLISAVWESISPFFS